MMTDRGLMKRYLLGTASPQERTALENEYLSDADAFEELTEVENDLIDSYTRGKLSDLEKQEFEKRYLASPKGRARADFSLALTDISAKPHQTTSLAKPSFWQGLLASLQQRSPIFQWGLAAACAVVLVVAIGSLRMMHNRDLQARLQPPSADHRTVSQPPAAITARLTTQTPSRGTGGTAIAKLVAPSGGEFTLRLNPGVSRTVGSGAPEAFVVPSGTSWLNLQLGLDDDNGSAYVALVETAEGSEVRRVEALKSRVVSGRRVVVVRLPARLIRVGDYIVDLRVTGDDKTKEESVESYSFRVVDK